MTTQIQSEPTQIFQFKRIKVLGYTTDHNKCQCCGRENLRGTISILDIESEVIAHFGTTCAAKYEKYDNLRAYMKANREISYFVRKFREDKKLEEARKIGEAKKLERQKKIGC